MDTFIPPVNIISNDSIKLRDCSETSDSKDDIDTYKGRYVEKYGGINFSCDLVLYSTNGLETITFSITNIRTLKEKDNSLCEKEEGKLYLLKDYQPHTVTPYITADKIKF